MPGYAEVQDIADEYKGMTFTSTSAVKDSQVQGMLDQATAYINGKVGMRYVLPITAPDALSVLKNICVMIVVQRLKPLLKIDTGGAAKGSQTPGSDDLKKAADQALADIQSNATDLTVLGALLKTAGDGIDSSGRRNPPNRKFRTDTDQW